MIINRNRQFATACTALFILSLVSMPCTAKTYQLTMAEYGFDPTPFASFSGTFYGDETLVSGSIELFYAAPVIGYTYTADWIVDLAIKH